MKICIWWTGKTKAPYDGMVTDYLHRIKRFHSAELKEFKSKKGTPSQSKQREGEAMLKLMAPTDLVFLLDESGRSFSSLKFSSWIDKQLQSTSRRLIFIIGGPFGFIEPIKNRAHDKLSLSSMTFTHDMARVIFLEQIYRAFTIKNNLPYHHE